MEREKESLKLFVNSRDEDVQAYRAIVGAGIECDIHGTFSEELAEDKSPVLYVGYRKLTGIDEIEKYVEMWKECHAITDDSDGSTHQE